MSRHFDYPTDNTLAIVIPVWQAEAHVSAAPAECYLRQAFWMTKFILEATDAADERVPIYIAVSDTIAELAEQYCDACNFAEHNLLVFEITTAIVLLLWIPTTPIIMIQVLFNFLFVFNMNVSDELSLEIKRHIDVLKNLMITHFEVVMVPYLEKRCRTMLYEDPAISLINPDEISNADLTRAMFSAGIIENVDLDYNYDTFCFLINKDVNGIKKLFTGSQTLLFLEIPEVSKTSS